MTENTMQEELPEGILDDPEFAAFFDADLEPTVLTFRVKEAPEPGTVTLKPMDGGDLERYAMAGVKTRVEQQDGKQLVVIDNIDQSVQSLFLVLHTLVDWSIPTKVRKPNGTFAWQLKPAPEVEHQRRVEIEKRFRCTPDAWTWLVAQCKRVNGLTGEPVKNSP